MDYREDIRRLKEAIQFIRNTIYSGLSDSDKSQLEQSLQQLINKIEITKKPINIKSSTIKNKLNRKHR